MHRKNTQLHIRVTREEYERILENCEAKGYSTLADYVRYQALEKDKDMEERIVQIHKMVQRLLEIVRQGGV